MEKFENIIILGEDFLKALRRLNAKSLSEKELLDLDDLKDRMNSHFDFFLASSINRQGAGSDHCYAALHNDTSACQF